LKSTPCKNQTSLLSLLKATKMSSPIKQTTKRKHQDAINAFNKLASVTETFSGVKVRKFNNDYCIAKAAHQHYMAPATLKSVLFSCNSY